MQGLFVYKRAAILVSLTTATSSAEDDPIYKSLGPFSVEHTNRVKRLDDHMSW